ncbi:hypothetical protein [Mesorhizobium sp.]|uniref:GHMP family kinase ATP-binding protein n=1 Tax=Mesorhizobium sp. TaxID=1871066 RepID=UPI0011FE5A9B|nr:hypothetical protein [Mesorhizobium sp.]TIV56421.1 MAG: hypothetical protein E5V80_26985 [Mesorhizobium sp.]
MSLQNSTPSVGPAEMPAGIKTSTINELNEAACADVWKPYMHHQTFDREGTAGGNTCNGRQPATRCGEGSALCCGTFGELLQGQVSIDSTRDSHFLVTMPIALFARAHFMSIPGTRSVTVYPSHKVKAKQLAERLASALGVSGGTLLLQSELPEGKGLASSSADLVAAARSIAACFNRRVHTSLIEQVMAEIEPSDGVMYPGVVAYNQRSCQLFSFLGQIPPLAIIGIDEGGTVETVDYDQRRGNISASQRDQYQELLERTCLAIPRGDTAVIGEVATTSALLHQERAPKKHLNSMLKACEDTHGLGVIVAHSGTMIGILLDRMAPDFPLKLKSAVAQLSRLDRSPKIYLTMDGCR